MKPRSRWARCGAALRCPVELIDVVAVVAENADSWIPRSRWRRSIETASGGVSSKMSSAARRSAAIARGSTVAAGTGSRLLQAAVIVLIC